MNIHEDQRDELKWSSHLPALLACVAATDGPVLELGVGHFSTPVLHAICVTTGRLLTSVEQDREWHSKFQDRYSASWHQFFQGEYDDVISSLAFKYLSVAFIDNSPGGARRAKDFAALLPVSELVVVHDMQREGDNYPAILPMLKGVNHHLCTDYYPHTLIASRTRNIPGGIL